MLIDGEVVVVADHSRRRSAISCSSEPAICCAHPYLNLTTSRQSHPSPPDSDNSSLPLSSACESDLQISNPDANDYRRQRHGRPCHYYLNALCLPVHAQYLDSPPKYLYIAPLYASERELTPHARNNGHTGHVPLAGGLRAVGRTQCHRPGHFCDKHTARHEGHLADHFATR